MSIIAWDGETLAADKRACLGTLIRTTTKIFRVGTALAGYAGDADRGEEMLAWYNSGAEPKAFPEKQRNDDTWAGLLVILRGGKILKYERSAYPVKFPPQQFAIGCGRDFALAAMYLGNSASQAV